MEKIMSSEDVITQNIKINLYQSFYSNEHRKHLSKMVRPLNINGVLNDKTREFELFKNIYQNFENKKDAWGLISWKFNLKNIINVDEFLEFAAGQIHAGADCVFINPMIGNEAIFKNVWEQGLLLHKSMGKIVDYIMLRHGEDINHFMGSTNFAFCNYFIAKPIFWEKYFHFIDSEINSLYIYAQEDEQLRESLENSANYSRDAKLSINPFVIERLFSLFVKINNDKMNIVNYPYDENKYIKKFGIKLGVYLWRLRILKDVYLKTNNDKYYIHWQKLRNEGFKNGLIGIVLRIDDPEVYLY
jgi:hypothetical protein